MDDLVNKPPTIRSHPFKVWVRATFLSPHLRRLPKDKQILDLACGWGFSFRINPNIVGLDYDDACVAQLIKEGRNARKGNILQPLPFPEGTFDIVFTHDVLEHFSPDDSERIFRNVLPILKPGGLFLNIIPNKLGYDFGLEIGAGHVFYVTPEYVEEVAKRTGFEYRGYYHSPFPKFFDKFYKHNKRVITCVRPLSPSAASPL